MFKHSPDHSPAPECGVPFNCPSSRGAGVSPPARPAVPALRMSGAHVPPCFVSQAERFPTSSPIWQALVHARLRARAARFEAQTTNGKKGARIARATQAAMPKPLTRLGSVSFGWRARATCVSHAHAIRPTASPHLSPHLLPVPRVLRRCTIDAHNSAEARGAPQPARAAARAPAARAP